MFVFQFDTIKEIETASTLWLQHRPWYKCSCIVLCSRNHSNDETE